MPSQTAAGAAADGPVLALDAMGVLHEAGDDVAELLVPFAGRNGSTTGKEAIEAAYLEASLGRIDAAAFCQSIGLDAELEDQYLAQHRLVDGVHALLITAGTVFSRVCCISNDVPAWSTKLRRSFGLEVRSLPGSSAASWVSANPTETSTARQSPGSTSRRMASFLSTIAWGTWMPRGISA